jgi:hypothetical protein
VNLSATDYNLDLSTRTINGLSLQTYFWSFTYFPITQVIKNEREFQTVLKTTFIKHSIKKFKR